MSSKLDSTLIEDEDTGRSFVRIPLRIVSEQEMAKDAPTVVNVLKKHDQLDLAEMLGLNSYLKEV